MPEINIIFANSYRGVNESTPWYVYLGEMVLAKFREESEAITYADNKRRNP